MSQMEELVSTVSDGSPILPPELERGIFELACSDAKNKGIAYRLTLVARRARIWIEPLLYKVVVLGYHSSALFLRTINSRPPSFFAENVKSLCLSSAIMDAEVVAKILAACNGLTNLACWTSVHAPYLLADSLMGLSTSLSCLSIDLTQLFRRGPNFSHPLFANLTHLELLDRCNVWDWTAFEHVPKLTHLALDFWSTRNIALGLAETLESCSNLQIIVFVQSSHTKDVSDIEAIGDPRVVFVTSKNLLMDWEDGARGGDDIWTRGAQAMHDSRVFKLQARKMVVIS